MGDLSRELDRATISIVLRSQAIRTEQSEWLKLKEIKISFLHLTTFLKQLTEWPSSTLDPQLGSLLYLLQSLLRNYLKLLLLLHFQKEFNSQLSLSLLVSLRC